MVAIGEKDVNVQLFRILKQSTKKLEKSNACSARKANLIIAAKHLMTCR